MLNKTDKRRIQDVLKIVNEHQDMIMKHTSNEMVKMDARIRRKVWNKAVKIKRAVALLAQEYGEK